MGYREGDLVRAVNGTTVIEGELESNFAPDNFWIGKSDRTTSVLLNNGFSITVLKEAPARFPVVHGFYVIRDSCVAVTYLLDDKGWAFVDQFNDTLKRRTEAEMRVGMGIHKPDTLVLLDSGLL